MFDPAHTALLPAREVARSTPLSTARNGLRWASYGYTEVPADTLQHIVEAVPPTLAAVLKARAYYFVPLAIGETESPDSIRASSSSATPSYSTAPISDAASSADPTSSANPTYDPTSTYDPALSYNPASSPDPVPNYDDLETEIAPGYTLDLSDRATCHRTLSTNGVESTFISARLMQDKFALAFEFFINIGHQFVDTVPVPDRFQALLWSQALAAVRGETSQDAYESRKRALDAAPAPANSVAPPRADPASGNSLEPADVAPSATDPTPARPRGAAAPLSFRATLTAASGTTPSLFAIPESNGSPRRLSEASTRRSNSSGAGAFPSTPLASGSLAFADALAHDLARPEPNRTAFFEAAFADALAIYMLSLTLDLDYADLREREYPLLAAPALADRLRLVADLYPPPLTYDFAIRYRRRH